MESWQAYLEEHRDEITAIQLLSEARDRRISFDDIQELADRIARPPYNWTPDVIWDAYVALGAPDRGSGATRARARPDRPGVPAPLHGRRRRRARALTPTASASGTSPGSPSRSRPA